MLEEIEMLEILVVLAILVVLSFVVRAPRRDVVVVHRPITRSLSQ